MVSVAHIRVDVVIVVSVSEDVVEHKPHNSTSVLEELGCKLLWVVLDSIERRHRGLEGNIEVRSDSIKVLGKLSAFAEVNDVTSLSSSHKLNLLDSVFGLSQVRVLLLKVLNHTAVHRQTDTNFKGLTSEGDALSNLVPALSEDVLESVLVLLTEAVLRTELLAHKRHTTTVGEVVTNEVLVCRFRVDTRSIVLSHLKQCDRKEGILAVHTSTSQYNS